MLTPVDRIHRMRSRSWVFHILYIWESQEERRSLLEVMEEILRTRRIAKERRPLVRRHVEALAEGLPEVDRVLRSAVDNWRLERLSRVDRAVLRLAAAELLFLQDVPPKVSIQEGVRLAGQYGGDESPRFVNGVLDAVYRAHGRAS